MEPSLLPHTSKRRRIRMQLHDIPQPTIFITKANSAFSIPIRCIFQLIKIILSGHHQVSQTSSPPPRKNPSFPYPRCCTVQYISQLKSASAYCHACMHTCITRIPSPTPPRIPDSRAELNRGNVAPSPPYLLTIHYLTVHCIHISLHLYHIYSLFVN